MLKSCYPCPTLETREIPRTSGLADNPDIVLVCAKCRSSGKKAVQEVHFATITDDIGKVDGAIAWSKVTIRSRKRSCIGNKLRKRLFSRSVHAVLRQKKRISYTAHKQGTFSRQLTTGRVIKLVANDAGIFRAPQRSTNCSPFAANAQFHSSLHFRAATNKTNVACGAGSIGRS